MALGEIGDPAHYGSLGVGLVIPRLGVVIARDHVPLGEHRKRPALDLDPVRVVIDQALEVG